MKVYNRKMATLFQGLKNMFTRKNGKNGVHLANAYSALNTNANIAAAKTRICGLLDQKIQQGKKLDITEARYAVQHCNKTRNQVKADTQNQYIVTPGSPYSNSPAARFLNKAMNSPISPLRYPNEADTKMLGGKRRKTYKRRHSRRHTRKH